MSTLPRLARIYWALVCLSGLGAFVVALAVPLPTGVHSIWEFGAFVALALLVGGKKVNLNPQRKDEVAGSLSLGFAITFAGLLRLGPNLAVLIAVASCFSCCMWPRRQRWHQFIFNVSLSALDGLAGGAMFAFLNGWTVELNASKTFIALVGSSVTFFLLNTFGVATMISLISREGLYKIWRENFSWTIATYLAGACVGGLAMLLFKNSSVATVLFALPVAYLVYQSYATYVARAQERQRHLEEKQKHIDELQKNQARLADLYLATIKSLALAIDAKDQYTHQHIVRVQRYAVAIALEMGLEGDEFEAVRTGALLHDVGKLGVPEYVLLKPGPLTKEEYEKVKLHPEIGAAILDPVEFPWPVLPVVRSHHERWDGNGYPDQLKGEDIPRTARIMAVADVYDAVTSTRSYRRARTHELAVELIREESGKQFAPDVVEAFLKVIDGVVKDMEAEGTGPLVQAQAAAAVEESKAAQAAKHISRASTELLALYEVAQSLSGSLGLKHTAELVIRKVEEIYPGATCVFFLWEPESRSLIADSAFGVSRDLFVNAYTNDAASVSRRVLEKNETYSGSFDPTDLTLIHGLNGQWSQPKTALIVPVYYEERAVGTLNLYHHGVSAFGDYDRELLELIADRASSALYNGILYDRTRGDSLSDPLTGVYNLRFATGRVDALVDAAAAAEDDSARFAMLCLDLDSFKPINDGFGHAKGNVVLQEVANLLSETVGSEGIVARYDGDGFVVVAPGIDRVEGERIARRLQRAVETYEPQLHHERLGQLQMGISVGVACFPEDGRDGSSLLSVAENRMYIMKTERRLRPLARTSDAAFR